MVVTDDPLPVIAWFVLAGIVTVLGSVAIYIDKCKTVDVTVEGATKDEILKFQAKCDK